MSELVTGKRIQTISLSQQECRIRKNFSSLRAIVSALQSNPIYRLKRAWASVHK